MLQKLSRIILKAFGWNVTGDAPNVQKLVIIGAPHTSNWDFPLSLLSLSALGLKFSWVGKHTLFTPPFHLLFKAIGGIPVNRTKRSSFLDKISNEFTHRDRLILAIAPEGTRSKTDHWKAGFYYIAMAANVEICMGYVDYKTKSVGLGPHFKPTGNVLKDFASIESFYREICGKHPDLQNDIKLRDKEVNLLTRELLKSKNQK